MTRPALMAIAAAVAACGSPDQEIPTPDVCQGASASGNAKDVLTVQALEFTEAPLPTRLLVEGDSITLHRAPQGGHVLLIGARVSGLSSSLVNVRARLRNPDSMAIVNEEARDVELIPVPGATDEYENDRSNVAHMTHVPACPDYEVRDVVDLPHLLEVTVSDLCGDEASGTVTLTVIPSCDAPDGDATLCRCECSANYTLGKCR